jgi:thioredoxin-like negative regulator of GroEL
MKAGQAALNTSSTGRGAGRDDATRTQPARPLLLFFHRRTSGSSRRVEAFLAQVLQRRRNHDVFLVHRIDADSRPDLVARFCVDQIPTLIVIADNRVQARLAVPRGCAEIARALARWLN